MEDKKKQKPQLPESLKRDIREMCDELSRSLRFMRQVIKKDNDFFEDYFNRHGDIKYRPKIREGDEEGLPTEIDMIMKADSLGLPIKRLIDTITVIQTKLVELDPEEVDSTYSTGEEKEHEEDLEARAQRLLDEAMAKKERGE